MVRQIVAAQSPKVDILQLIIVLINKLLQVVCMCGRISNAFASLIGGGKTEVRVALKMHRFFFKRIVNYHKNFLLTHFGHLDALLENAAASFAKGHVSFFRLFDFLGLVDSSSSH